jgi:hypothetical protein
MMAHRGRLLLAVGAAMIAPALLAVPAPSAGGYSLQFGGTRAETADIVLVKIDEPSSSVPGPPVDVGAGPFTIEWFMRATAADNPERDVLCGANESWLQGNVLVDRDRNGANRKFGVSVADGHVIFGVSSTADRTICGSEDVLDGAWHHVAVQYRPSDGAMWLFVDGTLDASGYAPPGDVSYPDDAIPSIGCDGAPCTSDTYLAFGSSKLRRHPAYKGSLDEIRVSSKLRYVAGFTPPRAAFAADADTAALYHFDEGNGTLVHDDSGADGGPSQGTRHPDAADLPRWSSAESFAATADGGSGGATQGGTAGGGGSGGATQDTTGSPAEPGDGPARTGTGAGPARSTNGPPKADAPAAPAAKDHPFAFGASGRGGVAAKALPPIAIALIGVGIAVFIAARFLRNDRL